MARIRSHHQGPGDPPSRSSGRKRRASSLASTEPSQQSIESSHGATTANEGRSTSPNSRDETHQSPKKRVKRAIVDDHDQLAQELQDAVSNTEKSIDSPTRNNVRVIINSKPQKRTRFSEPPPFTENETTTPSVTPPQLSSQPPIGLTPHLERIGAFPPTKSGRHARFSLPATLDSGDIGTTNGSGDVREVQFTPLRAVLDNRMKRRLRRSHLSEEVNEIEEHLKDDAKDKKELRELRRQVKQKDEREKELMLELELQRQMGINIHDDEKITELEAELSEVRQELTDLKAQSIFSGSERAGSEDRDMDFDIGHGIDSDDENEDELVDPVDLNVSQEDMQPEPHVNGFYSSQSSFSLSRITNSQSISEQASQVKLPNPAHEADLRNFEEALGNARRELSEIRSALDMFTMQLQGLGFADDHAAVDVILQTIRTSFREARVELEVLLPGSAPPDLKNGALLNALTSQIYGLMKELNDKTVLADNHNRMERMLRAQNNGLLDKLAEFESRHITLQQERADLATQKENTISELEDQLQTAHSALDQREKEVSNHEIKINGLEDEVADQTTSIQRLQRALDGYREEVYKLEALVSSTEEDYKARVEQLKLDHADVVEDLNSQLADETKAREEAEAESDQKSAFIDNLEDKIDYAETHLDSLRAEVARVQASSDAEKAGREAAEAKVEEQTTFIANLEDTIGQAEESLKQLNSELEQLRTLADAERNQRETAEQDLDDRTTRIAELETKLRDEGIQANELRSKLFQVQNNKAIEVAKLKDEMNEREEYNRCVIQTEKDRANVAESESARRNVLIAEMELEIAKKEEAAELMKAEHDGLVNARDETIARLEENLTSLEEDYTSLKESTDLQIATLQANINSLTDTIKERDSTIAILQDEAIESAEQHQFMIEQQNDKIGTLTTDLTSARSDIDHLNDIKASLEKRVHETASELLRITNVHADEIEALEKTVKSRNAEIADLTTTNQQRVAEFETTLQEKTAELEAMHQVADVRAVDITKLVAQMDEFKEAFRKQQEDGEATIKALQEGMQTAVQRADTLSSAYCDRAAEAGKVVDAFKFEGVKVTGPKLDLQRVIEGRVGKVKEKVRVTKKGRKNRRVFDSGIGVEDDDEEEAVTGAENGQAVNGF
ncbi:uncharacterized protein BDZ99DRAFT_549194 [Mytilinidion resinicola]|uniref:Uncharacterized protein n=1 Tax=Mytilinidion resinicola TaxID=574789 RepID=A0A6A6Z193_9PEZI|nr:uncharacterized protein BDZ99DRAFT_549194 [Mytilinidion resinicola]KAF2814932.1 hypothetical protein BDZ99DRAFT_549194 [Mytilinidion resinicola]